MIKKRDKRGPLNVKNSKKGLSPVIATVLLIALVLVLAAIVFLWARGFISEQIQKFGQPVDVLCEQVSFEAELVKGNLGYELEIANRGNVDISNFDIKEVERGNKIIQKFKFSVSKGGSIQKGISLNPGTEQIIIYPALLGNVKGKTANKIYTCTDKGTTITL